MMVKLPHTTGSPLQLYQKIATQTNPSFLFESGKGPSIIGRYSFLGTDPYQIVSGKNGNWILRTSEGYEQRGAAAFNCLEQLISQSPTARPPGAPPFFGGAVGYFSYDLVRQFERIPVISRDDLTIPDLEFAFFDLVTAIDHEVGCLILMFCPPPERFLGEPREKLYREGCDRLAALEARLCNEPMAEIDKDAFTAFAFTPEQEPAAYINRVRRCQEYIAAGDIYQANLSHRFTASCDAFNEATTCHSDLVAYARVSTMNPSPFSGLLRLGHTRLVSSSPERLVRLQGRQAETRPIAGTRPRGRTTADDRRLIDELRANEKERAEHVMLVDLERNDLGRVCDFGTVHVEELMALEQYSHVHHLVSNITGRLRDGATGFDLIRATFPGGTITGVPKIRCLEVIEELEPVRRGPYTGSMGYLSWSGDLDFNILIRTLAIRNGRGYLQVGAGIVADSDPIREYEETLYKAQAFFSAFS